MVKIKLDDKTLDLIKSKYDDGTIKYFDNGYYFKVVR